MWDKGCGGFLGDRVFYLVGRFCYGNFFFSRVKVIIKWFGMCMWGGGGEFMGRFGEIWVMLI